MSKIAIIGGGISGLSMANLLQKSNHVTVFERDSKPGGLIKCEVVNGNLYHTVGGHVFNSKRKDVLNWFWSFFDCKKDFVSAIRNATISMPEYGNIGYPIENHLYQLPKEVSSSIIKELVERRKIPKMDLNSFEMFLQDQFGTILYEMYFRSYNEKIWKKPLNKIPLSWLEDKLPMPTVEDIMLNNIYRVEEQKMVHSSFFYAKKNGSQFLADVLAKHIGIKYNTEVMSLEKDKGKWIVNGECFDKIIFCGNIKQLPALVNDSFELTDGMRLAIKDLEYHGTTSVFCKIDKNPYSWIYMPSREYLSHRIICTGNFSQFNNVDRESLTATVEFTDYLAENEIRENLLKIPYNPQYITHKYTEYTYPIQTDKTREMINSLKRILKLQNIYLLGRFAEWEYYNMDAAIGAAIDLYNNNFRN